MKKLIKAALVIVLLIAIIEKYPMYFAWVLGITLAIVILLGYIMDDEKDDSPSSPYPWWYMFGDKDKK